MCRSHFFGLPWILDSERASEWAIPASAGHLWWGLISCWYEQRVHQYIHRSAAWQEGWMTDSGSLMENKTVARREPRSIHPPTVNHLLDPCFWQIALTISIGRDGEWPVGNANWLTDGIKLLVHTNWLTHLLFLLLLLLLRFNCWDWIYHFNWSLIGMIMMVKVIVIN